MRTGVFLQVRLDSRRLPRKALLPLPGGTVIQHAMRALKGIPAEVHALLTDRPSADALSPLAGEEGFSLLVGPTEDVLERFCRGIVHYRVKRVIRATGDNPLVSTKLALSLLTLHQAQCLDLSHFCGPPLGTGVEVMEASVLLEAGTHSSDPYEREHITTYAYRRPEAFRIGHLPGPDSCRLPGARVTLDTEEDYRLIHRIFNDLYRKQPLEAEEVVAWFQRTCPPKERNPQGQEKGRVPSGGAV